MEIGYQQGSQALALMQEYNYRDREVKKDLSAKIGDCWLYVLGIKNVIAKISMKKYMLLILASMHIGLLYAAAEKGVLEVGNQILTRQKV